MQNIEQTIASQYANSPILLQLINGMNGYIDPSADIESFLENVIDVDTSVGFGLDRIGKIVNASRQIRVTPSITTEFFGFKNTGNQPFGQAPFYSYLSSTDQYLLSDDAYRTLLKLKMLVNISQATIPAINQILLNLFFGRGRCYCTDLGLMSMNLVFEFELAPFEISILTQSNVLPKPTGVNTNILQTNAQTFGFKQQTGAEPFGQGNFFTRTTGLIPIN